MKLLTCNDVAGQYPQSWYAATAEPPPPCPELEGEIRADVAIVGGGFTGLSAALHLAQAGMDVVLLEAHRVGFGASGRNGGQVGSGFRLGQRALEKQLGQTEARALWDLSEEAKTLTRSLVADHAPDARYRPGILETSTGARDLAHEHDDAKWMNDSYGTALECLGKDELEAILGSTAYAGGTLDRSAGHIHPLRYAFGLARAARAAGARVFELSPVHELRQGSAVRLRTPKGVVRANHVILACNGYLDDLEPSVAARVMPINSFMAATEPLGARAKDILREDFAVADDLFVVNYYRLSEDGRLLFGGGEGYTAKFPDDITAKVRRPMTSVFPQLEGVRIDYAWGGTLGISLSRLPVFRRVSKNIVSASGFSGHGVALSGLAGKVMGEAVRGQADRFDTLAALPQRPFPGGTKLRAPLLVLAMSWYGLRDRLGV